MNRPGGKPTRRSKLILDRYGVKVLATFMWLIIGLNCKFSCFVKTVMNIRMQIGK